MHHRFPAQDYSIAQAFKGGSKHAQTAHPSHPSHRRLWLVGPLALEGSNPTVEKGLETEDCPWVLPETVSASGGRSGPRGLAGFGRNFVTFHLISSFASHSACSVPE
jgi:hypothetical protein